MRPADPLWKGRGLIAAAALLWSTSGFFIKALTRSPEAGGAGWSPFQVAGFRSLVAAAVILVGARVRRLPNARELVVAVCTASLMICYVLAQTYTSTANAILLQYTFPVYMLALAPLVLKERPRLPDILAAPPIIAGVVLIFLSGGEGEGSLFGNVMGFASGVFYALLLVALRKWPGAGGLAGLGWGNALAAAVAIPVAALAGGGLVVPGAKPLAEIIFLGVVQIALAYYLFSRAMAILRAIEASLITMIEPVACPLWSFIALGERPAALAVVGGAVILATLAAHTLAVARSATPAASGAPRPSGREA